jgi:hypothetical protein
MRLIDADALPISFDGHTVSVWKKDLDAAPTINPYKWISVEDKLPEKFVDVLCFYPSKNYGGNVEIDYMESDRGYFASQFKYGTPTHWMPLPTPPTEKENKL